MGVFSSKFLNKKDFLDDAYKACDTSLGVISLNTPLPVMDLDPRSPTIGIARTPIEISSKYEMEFEKLNKSCNDITLITQNCDSAAQYTPNAKQNSDLIRKRLLKTSSLKYMNKISASVIEKPSVSNVCRENCKSKIGLLETNLDYQETDIDQATKLRNSRGNLYKALPAHLIDELNDPRSPGISLNRTPVRVLKSLDVELRSPSNEIMRTPIQILNAIDNITFDDIEPSNESSDSLEIEPILSKVESTNSLFISKSNNDIPSLIPIEKSMDDFRKSSPDIPNIEVSIPPNQSKNFIYEDIILNKTPPHKTPIYKSTNQRTPLSIRNGNGPENENNGKTSLKKSLIREHMQISKIPTYKKIRKNQQCENTPPNVTSKNNGDFHKGKKAQWDGSEKTMII